MSDINHPHLGDIVGYHLTSDEVALCIQHGGTGKSFVPALVTAVHSSTCLNLTVMPDMTSVTFPKSSVVRGTNIGQFDDPCAGGE